MGWRSGDVLEHALAHSGDAPGALWRTLWGALWTLWGWMDDADDGGGDGDGDGEDLRLSFLYIQTPDQPPPRPLCYAFISPGLIFSKFILQIFLEIISPE